MSALIPAIIELIMSRRGGGGGGGRGGGRPHKSPEEMMRDYMAKKAMGDIDAIDQNTAEALRGTYRSDIPQLRQRIESLQGLRYSPVLPGEYASPQGHH